MGLDTSHDAFHGAYSAYNRFRQAVCKAAGGSFPPHEKGAVDDNGKLMDPNSYYLDDEYEAARPGLSAFLRSNDCEGEFSPELCAHMARDLAAYLPALEAMGRGVGHIEHRGGYGEVLRKFIAGCQAAADAGEPLVFG